MPFLPSEKGQRWLNSQTAAFEAQRCVSNVKSDAFLAAGRLSIGRCQRLAHLDGFGVANSHVAGHASKALISRPLLGVIIES